MDPLRSGAIWGFAPLGGNPKPASSSSSSSFSSLSSSSSGPSPYGTTTAAAVVVAAARGRTMAPPTVAAARTFHSPGQSGLHTLPQPPKAASRHALPAVASQIESEFNRFYEQSPAPKVLASFRLEADQVLQAMASDANSHFEQAALPTRDSARARSTTVSQTETEGPRANSKKHAPPKGVVQSNDDETSLIPQSSRRERTATTTKQTARNSTAKPVSRANRNRGKRSGSRGSTSTSTSSSSSLQILSAKMQPSKGQPRSKRKVRSPKMKKTVPRVQESAATPEQEHYPGPASTKPKKVPARRGARRGASRAQRGTAGTKNKSNSLQAASKPTASDAREPQSASQRSPAARRQRSKATGSSLYKAADTERQHVCQECKRAFLRAQGLAVHKRFCRAKVCAKDPKKALKPIKSASRRVRLSKPRNNRATKARRQPTTRATPGAPKLSVQGSEVVATDSTDEARPRRASPVPSPAASAAEAATPGRSIADSTEVDQQRRRSSRGQKPRNPYWWTATAQKFYDSNGNAVPRTLGSPNMLGEFVSPLRKRKRVGTSVSGSLPTTAGSRGSTSGAGLPERKSARRSLDMPGAKHAVGARKSDGLKPKTAHIRPRGLPRRESAEGKCCRCDQQCSESLGRWIVKTRTGRLIHKPATTLRKTDNSVGFVCASCGVLRPELPS